MIYVFTGDNDYLINFKVNELVNKLRKSNNNFDIEKLDGENLSANQLKENLSTLSIFTSNRIIILSDIDKVKNINDEIKEIISKFDDSIELIITFRSVDKRLSLYSNLKKLKNFNELNRLSLFELKKWAEDYVFQNKAKISPEDLNFLINRIGDNQFLLKNELDKLLLVSTNINRKEIEDLTDASINSKIFDLLNSAFEGNKKKTMKLYDEQRYLKVEPSYILAMITWQLTNLAFIVFGKNISQDELIKISKLSPYTISNTRKLLNKIDQHKLTKLISKLSDIDFKSKTSSMNLDEALKNYLLTIS